MGSIRFGTDGWRAVISEDFTFENVRHVTQAYADYLKQAGTAEKGVVIGYDARFLSDRYAREAARVMAANHIRAYLTREITPTPAMAWAIREKGAAGGIMVTASHNPYEWNGIKIKDHYAGAALPELTRAIEARLEANIAAGKEPRTIDYDAAVSGGGIELIDAKPSYLRQLRSLVDAEVIRGAGLKVVVDAMYGAGSGYLAPLLEEMGVEVIPIRHERNPLFPGISPEPIKRNLGALMEAVREHRADMGLVMDGDADRVGAVDAHGHLVDSQRIFSLLLQHLHEDRGWQGAVVKTFAVTQMVDDLAEKYGLKFYKKPVGFKYVCEIALEEPLLIGGEESGGLGVAHHIPERDGILCSLLLAEMAAMRGKLLHELVDDLMGELGYHCYNRLDLHLKEGRKEVLLDELRESPPKEIGGLPVEHVDDLDGYKFFLGPAGRRGWILFRASGTEPIVRVYAELDDEETLQRVLEAGRRIAEG